MRSPTILFKKRMIFILSVFSFCIIGLICRLVYIQIFKADFYQPKAYIQQTRQRPITPTRGSIVDRNGKVIAKNATVATVWVRPNIIPKAEKEKTAKLLSDALGLNYENVLKKVSKVVALEKIEAKVDQQIGDKIRALNLTGVMVDDDSKRYYPYETLAANVVGFVGKDNQGIVGLEAKYESYLKGIPGTVLEETDARGIELSGSSEKRIEPENGLTLRTTIDLNIQQVLEQELQRTYIDTLSKRTTGIVMDPRDGSILAMAQYPSYDLNQPFKIQDPNLEMIWDTLPDKEQFNQLNQMWRNFGLNDTYEPGSTFKILTSAAGLEEGVVKPDSTFHCNGYVVVEGTRIKCWYFPRAHGAETFVEGVQNSCNPVFIETASRLGADKYFDYLNRFGLRERTGIDLAGEAIGILHNPKKVGPVELATTSFGQSIQISPLQLLRASASIVNGGRLVTPHLGDSFLDENGKLVKKLDWDLGRRTISKETSDEMRKILESVVSEGSGHKAYIPGMRIGGKTATAEKLPRGSGKRIASFLGFAPAEDPQIMTLIIIDEPNSPIKYGGQIAAPVVGRFYKTVLPYLGVQPIYNEKELEIEKGKDVMVPDFNGKTIEEAQKIIKNTKIDLIIEGEGSVIIDQFPAPNEKIKESAKVMLITKQE